MTWELEVYAAQSLKEKRSVVKSLLERLRQRHNVSVAETGHQDLWQRAELTACVVASARRPVEQVLAAVDRMVEEDARARIIRTERDIF